MCRSTTRPRPSGRCGSRPRPWRRWSSSCRPARTPCPTTGSGPSGGGRCARPSPAGSRSTGCWSSRTPTRSWRSVMPEPGLARTLAAAFVYLDLGGGSQDAVTEEVEDGWMVRLGDVAVLVPRESEAWARGQGLIGPGRGVLVGPPCGRRALEGALYFAAGPSRAERLAEVASGWRFAAEAVAEALKFFPGGEDELVPDDFWTPAGRSLRGSEPHRLTRRKLEKDLAFYRESLADFRRRHGR